ncbi:ComEA family DNA-binding protein [Candidatus Omnitrophota bacterium]
MLTYFSRQERLVLNGLVLVILIGSVCSYLFKRYPQLGNIVNVMDTDRLILKTDVNTATFDELVEIPYIGPVTARKILEYREEKGHINAVSELQGLPGIRDENYKKFLVYVVARSLSDN